MFTTNDIFEDALSDFSGVARNSFSSPNTIIKSAVRRARTEIYFPEAKREAPLLPAVYSGDFKYVAPEDLDRVIDIIPYAGRGRIIGETASNITTGQYEYLTGAGSINTSFLSTSPNEISFDTNHEQQLFTTEYRMGTKLMRINQPLESYTPLVLHDCDSTTDNGTVTVGGDASNVDTNTVFYMNGIASIDFDITQSTGVSTITFSDISSVDMSTITRDGAIGIGLYVPAALQNNITQIDIAVGNDELNYLSMSATTNEYGGSFTQGFNGVRFERRSASTTGTVDETAIDYIKITITHTAGATGVKIDSIFAAQGIGYGLYYYSNYYYIDSTTGAFKLEPTSTGLDDYVVFDGDTMNIIVEECKKIMDRQLRGETSGDVYKSSQRTLYGVQGHANDDGLYVKYRRDNLSEKNVTVTGY